MEQQPSGFEQYLSKFGPVLYDGYCGEPVAWGFKIVARMDEILFRELGKYGQLECIEYGFDTKWALITKTLSREEAIEKYGPITNEVFGPRGGWKSTDFGSKQFISKYLKPEK